MKKNKTLVLAAIYNLIWGAIIILFPNSTLVWVGMEPLNHPTIWQGMGMVIGVYGLGYYWASFDYHRHWPIVAVGMLGKILGPIGYVQNLIHGTVDPGFGWFLITNDFIWWIPFGKILLDVHKQTKWKLT